MKAFLFLAGFLVVCGAARIAPAAANPAPKPVVVEIKNSAGQTVGTATLTDAAPGVRIKLEIRSLPPGEHSIHIHQVAKCDPPDFKTAGPHFSGTAGGHEHGAGAAAGDIPNFSLLVAADGTAHLPWPGGCKVGIQGKDYYEVLRVARDGWDSEVAGAEALQRIGAAWLDHDRCAELGEHALGGVV